MLYEFLQTFGETPGFDMESLSSLDILQRALLCGSEAEEELLSVMTHLLAGLRHRRPRNSASQLAHDSAGPDDETADLTTTNVRYCASTCRSTDWAT